MTMEWWNMDVKVEFMLHSLFRNSIYYFVQLQKNLVLLVYEAATVPDIYRCRYKLLGLIGIYESMLIHTYL